MSEHAKPKPPYKKPYKKSNRDSFKKPYAKPYEKPATDSSATMRKMQFQLDAIERKLDALLAQSNPRESRNTYPSKTYREFADVKRPFKQKHAKRKGEGKFYEGLQSGGRKSSRKKGKK